MKPKWGLRPTCSLSRVARWRGLHPRPSARRGAAYGLGFVPLHDGVFMQHIQLLLACAGLPSSVRLCFGQPCSPFEAGALPVLRPARRIHIRLRGRVLCNPPRLKGFRPASAQNKAAHGTLGSWANAACVRLSLRGKARLLPRAASTVRSAILRRRDTASSSRARPLAHHANRSLAVPLRSLLTHAPLARPSAVARFFS